MSGRVLVIGDALLDVRVSAAHPPSPDTDAAASISLEPGGQGANAAVRLARRGVPVTLVAALAVDPAGEMVRSRLLSEGVVLHELPAPATGTVVVIGDGSGERTMYSQRVPFADRVSLPPVDRLSWLLVSGYVLVEARSLDLARRLTAVPCRRAMLGCSLPDAAVERWLAAARAALPDLTVLNRDELEHLGTDAGLGLVVVTDAAGASIPSRERVSASTPRGAPAVDSTGAGDAFAAGLVGELLDDAWPPSDERLRAGLGVAVALAAEVARVAGAQAPVAGDRPAQVRA